ncbi:hypothetical protein FNY88_04195 [Corynebacterium guaraldiae]|uniref:Uncharacterized protein n=1 Tax=Corynebacterium guaraldiae TaxID=3051103 RepID=A0ABY3CW57_9CORY|nr:hypothetical protein [Corynebacterium guaraldiae]TRX49769.1 hypothetical protein FNY88_04195 [Corynebacterium guaraldiae]
MLNLNSWNLKHSKEVNQLLKAQQKLEEVIDAPAPDTSGLFDAKTLESTLDAMVNHSLVSGHERTQAVYRARNLIENRLNQAIQNNLDDYLAQASESFDAAAELYEANIDLLPSTPFTAEQALGFSAEEREAYDRVVQAAGVLSHWMGWALELTELPAEGLGPWSKWHTIVDAECVAGLMVLELEEGSTGNPAWGKTLPVVARAVQEGGTLRLATPSTAYREAQALEQVRQEMPDEDYRVLRAGLGY